MRSCGSCRKRDVCVSICPEVESRLPGEDAGTDPKKEVRMDASALESLAERYSYSGWAADESARRRISVDLSVLTPKERSAVMLVASGMSLRAAARRLKINLNALQSRLASARRRLSAGQFPLLAEGPGRPQRGKGGRP